MAKQSNGKKKATVWYDQVVTIQPLVFKGVQCPSTKRERRGF